MRKDIAVAQILDDDDGGREFHQQGGALIAAADDAVVGVSGGVPVGRKGQYRAADCYDQVSA